MVYVCFLLVWECNANYHFYLNLHKKMKVVMEVRQRFNLTDTEQTSIDGEDKDLCNIASYANG